MLALKLTRKSRFTESNTVAIESLCGLNYAMHVAGTVGIQCRNVSITPLPQRVYNRTGAAPVRGKVLGQCSHGAALTA
eukprot:2230323-Amphidinium_carterae.1